MSRSQKRRAELQTVSLRPAEKSALAWLADRLARGNRSAFVAGLIVKAAREEIGSDWEAVVSPPPIAVPPPAIEEALCA